MSEAKWGVVRLVLKPTDSTHEAVPDEPLTAAVKRVIEEARKYDENRTYLGASLHEALAALEQAEKLG